MFHLTMENYLTKNSFYYYDFFFQNYYTSMVFVLACDAVTGSSPSQPEVLHVPIFVNFVNNSILQVTH